MGKVWRAIQLSMKRQVALKQMNVAVRHSTEATSRFKREVELAGRLEHPNLARVYDSGVNRGLYYYVMELIDGVPLDRFAKSHALSQEGILRMVRVVCEAVQYAHHHGVIHCDLKPSNIIVTGIGQPYVVDFGLARALQEVSRDQTTTVPKEAGIVGTLAYMSPEQAAGEVDKIDTRTDIYALGVILYRLLTAEFPHDCRGSRSEVQRRIAHEHIRRPRDVGATVDKELESVLLKALAKSPQDRYASVRELARDIDHYLCGDPLTARRPTVVYFLRKRLRKYHVPITIAMAIVIGAISLVTFGYFRERHLRQRAEIANLITRAAIRTVLKKQRAQDAQVLPSTQMAETLNVDTE